MNLLHAVHAHGFVGSWLTGWAAYDPLVRDAFCTGEQERIAGFFFIGSPSREPVYVRLRDIIAEAILSGQFGDGDPLPSVRAFAAEQGANPLTVAKAYQGFQDEGLIVVRRGVGMFVADGARDRLSNSEREQFIAREWPAVRARMERLGIDPAELLERS